ncbi:class I SAM-dependent methyltransferase [Deltaproteobacteria bacterium OttesenSCG-928-K17]|nr:class I SAM-dependent methyltransferase [Deltaproteobacteria bacterium OttesenSCG-928-K17]
MTSGSGAGPCRGIDSPREKESQLPPADYHDYFIKDGRHIGRYEDMYRDCPDPWRIEELGPRLDMRAAALLLAGRGRAVGSFLDIGAGLGLFTKILTEALWAENPEITGVVTDISATAVARAEARLADPRLRFQALDVRNLGAASLPEKQFDLVVMAQVLWGIVEDIDSVLAAVAALLSPGGLLLFSQHFPGAERQTYGADIICRPEDLAARLTAAGFTVSRTLETDRAFNHHWAALAVGKN